MRADQVIIEPILSEKSNIAREQECKKYTFKVNAKANKFEIMNAVKEDRLVVVEDFTIEDGKTKSMASIVKNFVEDEKRTVVIMGSDDKMIRRASKNIPYLHVLAFDKLSAKELLYGKKVIVLESAAKNLNEFYND